MIRKTAGSRGKVTWNEEFEEEYQNVMQTRIRLSPHDPKKRLRLVIDGAKTVGTGILLIHYLNDSKPEEGVNIIHSGSGLLDPEKDYSRDRLIIGIIGIGYG